MVFRKDISENWRWVPLIVDTAQKGGTCYVSFPWTRHVSASEGERSRFRHISVITFPFFLVSVAFPVTYLFPLTHVKDRVINVSDILPLRPIKVNNGRFYLLLTSGYFVNGCVFTPVYVICKICEKLRRIPTAVDICWIYLNQYFKIWDKRSAGQRTFLLLTHAHWRRSIWHPFWKWLQRLLWQLLEALGAWSMFSFASR